MWTITDDFARTLHDFKYYLIDENDDEIHYRISRRGDEWYAWKWSYDIESLDYEHPMTDAELKIDSAVYERGQWYIYVRFYPKTED